MLFLVAGVLKEGTEQRLLDLHNEWNEHLSQPNRKISLMGGLKNKDGHRHGYVVILQADSFAEAEDYLRQSPFYQDHLYERVEVAEFLPQVGSIAS